jgi:hypothetical protein
MPMEKLDTPADWVQELPCTHPDHNIPSHVVLQPGRYKHTCAGCGQAVFVNIFAPVCEAGCTTKTYNGDVSNDPLSGTYIGDYRGVR